jgi:hypothetical protein
VIELPIRRLAPFAYSQEWALSVIAPAPVNLTRPMSGPSLGEPPPRDGGPDTGTGTGQKGISSSFGFGGSSNPVLT